MNISQASRTYLAPAQATASAMPHHCATFLLEERVWKVATCSTAHTVEATQQHHREQPGSALITAAGIKPAVLNTRPSKEAYAELSQEIHAG
eukprot:6214230-Pleurochrysis_carterae.AAC.7